MLKWALQSNLMKDHNIGKLADFLEAQGVRWMGIEVVPFDDSDISTREIHQGGITVFYGSVGLVRRVHQNNQWKPGVFFEPSAFAFQALRDGYGEDLLNADSEVLTMQEVTELERDPKSSFFCRPCEDDKAFTGKVFAWKELQEQAFLLKEVSPANRLQLSSRIQVASTKDLACEIRHFVVNGKISTSSFYGRGMMGDDVPQEDVEYAQRMAEKYQPAEVFALDTCRLQDGTKRVVETNCMNSSGLYWIDVWKLTKDINDFLRSKYT